MSQRKLSTISLQIMLSLLLMVCATDETSAHCHSRKLNCNETKHLLVQANQDINALLIEASQPQYTVRRIETTGNTFIGDRLLRRRIVLKEGDVFTMEKLNKSLANLRRLKTLNSARLSEVRLNREEKTVDLLFVIREKSTR